MPAEAGSPGAPRLPVGTWVVVALFTVSGVVHLVRPSVFESMVPGFLPGATALVLLSGVAELACAAGLLWRRTRWVAGWASVALLVAIFPANVSMSVDACQAWRDGEGSGAFLVGTLVRLPLQLPLIWWAWQATRSPRA